MAGPDNQSIESSVPKPPDGIPESRGMIPLLTQVKETLISVSEEVEGDILKRRLQHDISRLDGVQELISTGKGDTMGEVIPSIPYLNTLGLKRLKSFPLDSTRYDAEFKVADLLLAKLAVQLPEDKTISQFILDIDEKSTSNLNQQPPRALSANESAEWTFPTNVKGLGINVSHFLAGGGTSIRLVFESEGEPKDTDIRDLALVVDAIDAIPEALPDYLERIQAMSNVLLSSESQLKDALTSEKDALEAVKLLGSLASLGLEENKRDIGRFTGDFLARNAENIVSVLSNKAYEDTSRDYVYDWLSRVAQDYPDVASILADEVNKRFSNIVQSFTDKSIGVSLYHFVDSFGSNEQKTIAWEQFKKSMGDTDIPTREYISAELIKALPTQTEDFNTFLNDRDRQYKLALFLGVNGLRYNRLKEVWRIREPIKYQESRNTEILRNNLLRIRELEEARPGICKILHKEFGISHFGRYPSELLVKQYDEMHDVDTPYGIVLYPMDDWTGSHTQRVGMFVDLLPQLKDHFLLRVVETDSKFNAARHHVRLDKRYGQHNKISFALIGGHAMPTEIQLGGSRPRETINLIDLSKRGFQRISKYYIIQPSIILSGCKLAVEGGIAQKMSQFGANVIASKENASLEKLTLQAVVDGKPSFEAQFSKGPGLLYTSGKLSPIAA